MSDNVLQDPLFQNLSPLKKAVIAELMEKATNTPLDKAFPLLLKISGLLLLLLLPLFPPNFLLFHCGALQDMHS